MVRSSRHLAGFSDKRIGLGLQVPAAAPFDLAGPLDQPSEEGIHLLAHLGRCAEAGVCRHFFADPVPDGFIRVEVRAVAGQGRPGAA